MKTRLLTCLAICLSVPSAAGATDLTGLFRDALAHDAQYAAARASLAAGREQLPLARAGLLPVVALSASTTRIDQDLTLLGPPPTEASLVGNNRSWSVSATQPLYRPQARLAVDQAADQVVAAEVQFALARQGLALRVARAYFDVLHAHESLVAAREQTAAVVEQREAAERHFDAGTATVTDRDEAQARHDLAAAAEIAAQAELELKQQALRTITGRNEVDVAGATPVGKVPAPDNDDVEAWSASARRDNLRVRLAELASAIARREVARQRAGHHPTLDLMLATGSISASAGLVYSGVTQTRANSIGMQLSLPIFQGGATVSQERTAHALYRKANAELDDARRQAALQARQAHVAVRTGLAQVRALEAAMVSSQSALNSNRLGYEVGVRIGIDVLNAQSQLHDTRQKLVKARLDTLLATLELKAAAGTLGDADLAAIDVVLR